MSEQKPDPIKSQSAQQPPRRVDAVLIIMILAGVGLMVFAVVGIFALNRPAAGQQANAQDVTVQEAQAGAPVNGVRVGSRLADFALQDLNGSTVHLSDYQGHWVLINAWATWCPPCRAEMPQLNALYDQYQQSGFVVLGVNAGETKQQAADFVKELGLQFPIVLDPDESLMNRLSIHDYPTSILVDKGGLVKAVHIGYFSEDALNKEIVPYIKP